MEPEISLINLISNDQQLRQAAQNYLGNLSRNTDKFLDLMFVILEKNISKEENQLVLQLITLHINSDHYKAYTFQQYNQKRFPTKTLIWKFTTIYEKNENYNDQVLHLIEQLVSKVIISQHQNYYFLILEKMTSNVKFQEQQLIQNNAKYILKLIKLLQVILKTLYKRNCRPNYKLGYSLIDFLYNCSFHMPEIQQIRAQISILYMKYENMFQLNLVIKLFNVKPVQFANLISKKFIPMYRNWYVKHCKLVKLKMQDKHKVSINPLLKQQDCKYDYDYNLLTLENAIFYIYSSQFIQILYEDFRGACKIVNMIYQAFLIFFQLKPKQQFQKREPLFSEKQADKLTKRVFQIILLAKEKYQTAKHTTQNNKQLFDEEQQQYQQHLFSQWEIYQLLSVFLKKQQQRLIQPTIKQLYSSLISVPVYNQQHFIVFQFFAHFYQDVQFIVDMHNLADKCIKMINTIYDMSVHSLYSFLIQHIKCQIKQSNYHKVNRIQSFIGTKMESMGYSQFIVSIKFSIENCLWSYFLNILPIFFDGIDEKRKLYVLQIIQKSVQSNSNPGEQVLEMFYEMLLNTYEQCSLTLKSKYLSLIKFCLKYSELSFQTFVQSYQYLQKLQLQMVQQKRKRDFDEQIIKQQYYGIVLELYKKFNGDHKIRKCSFFPLKILQKLDFTTMFYCMMEEIQQGNNYWSGNSLGGIYNKLILEIIATKYHESPTNTQEKQQYQTYLIKLFTVICNEIFENKKSFLIMHLELFIALHEEILPNCISILSNILKCLEGTFQYFQIYQRIPSSILLILSQNKLAINSHIILSEHISIVGSFAYDQKSGKQLQQLLLYANNYQMKWYLLGYLNFIGAWILKYEAHENFDKNMQNTNNEQNIEEESAQRVDRKKQFYFLIEKLRTKNIVEKTQHQQTQSRKQLSTQQKKQSLENWDDIIQSLSNCSNSSSDSHYLSEVQNNQEAKLIQDLNKLDIQDSKTIYPIWPGTNRILVHYLATLTINGENSQHWIYPLEQTSLEKWSLQDFHRQQLLTIVRGFAKYL